MPPATATPHARPRIALGYARVSTQDQAREGLSLPLQREQIRAYAQVHQLDLRAVLADCGVSGGIPLGTRPEGARLVAALQSQQVGHLLAVRLDRLFRSAADCLAVTAEWDKLGVALHLLDLGGQSVDTSSTMGRFFLSVMSAAAELERNLTRERIQAVMASKRARREFSGTAPLGWRRAGHSRLEPDPQEQMALVLIAVEAVRGRPSQTTVDALVAARLPARRGRWHRMTVDRIRRRVLGGLDCGLTPESWAQAEEALAAVGLSLPPLRAAAGAPLRAPATGA